jgi:tRNA threonylcarbamoyladenosine biosynthesis protein TsaB
MNPLILYIETSYEVCSVCLAKGEELLGIKETMEPNSHAAKIAVFTDELLKQLNLSVKNLQAVCISAGPGSFTGLRIGASFAKGICYAADIPLLAVSTLMSMANGMKQTLLEGNHVFCPMIDARRMEVYTAAFDAQLNVLLPEQPMVLNSNSFSELCLKKTIFFGSGAKKLKSIRPEINEVFYVSSASHLIQPALQLFRKNEFADLAYFEPNYIKPFYSPKPKATGSI